MKGSEMDGGTKQTKKLFLVTLGHFGSSEERETHQIHCCIMTIRSVDIAAGACVRSHLHAVGGPAPELRGGGDVVLQLGRQLGQVQEDVAGGPVAGREQA